VTDFVLHNAVLNVSALKQSWAQGARPHRVELMTQLLVTWSGEAFLGDAASDERIPVESSISFASFATQLGDCSGYIRSCSPGMFCGQVLSQLAIRLDWCLVRTPRGRLLAADLAGDVAARDVTEMIGYRAVKRPH
jgi:hypothetical protein